MSEYLTRRETRHMPRLPLQGGLDLTYRCNFNCRHCWLRIPPGAPEKRDELSFDEIREVVDQARAMGCREWSISGGEPMLRPDFAEIFDYLISKSVSYSLNTNGTLITPKIAQLMRRKGNKMVALYGATAEVYDHVTRLPGSFEATMRGFAYLKEAGAGFTVQLIPMRDNCHQWDEMIHLAESLSPHSRLGATFLYLSAGGDPERNREIKRQRLAPRDVIEFDQPDLSYAEWQQSVIASTFATLSVDFAEQSPSSVLGIASAHLERSRRMRLAMAETGHNYAHVPGDDRLLASCIAGRRVFHVDPYGQMTFCCFIKDPALRYDLRQGSFQACWDEFIPALADQVRGGPEYLENCAACELRSECIWCPVFGYLEHRRFSAKVDYLCAVAQENRRFKENWKMNHRRYYQSGGITIQVDSGLPITDATFHPKFKLFQVDGPGEDTISIRHHFALPELNGKDLGEEVYRKPPWAIYKKGNSWIYLGISPSGSNRRPHRVAVFNHNHTRARIYHPDAKTFREGGLGSLTLFSTDQILLARVLADRQGCYLHSSGAILDGQGLLFVGHSDAGKTTMATMLKDKAEVLCDDRVIVRRWPDGFWAHGTWSHGEAPIVSASSAPLQAILFLEKAPENRLVPLDNRQEAIHRLLACLIKPFVTADWWEKVLSLVEEMAHGVPCYVLRFDKSGAVVEVLGALNH